MKVLIRYRWGTEEYERRGTLEAVRLIDGIRDAEERARIERGDVSTQFVNASIDGEAMAKKHRKRFERLERIERESKEQDAGA